MTINDELRQIACRRSADVIRRNQALKAQVAAKDAARQLLNVTSPQLETPAMMSQLLDAKARAALPDDVKARMATINFAQEMANLRAERHLDEPTPAGSVEELPTADDVLSGLRGDWGHTSQEGPETAPPEPALATSSYNPIDAARAHVSPAMASQLVERAERTRLRGNKPKG